MAYRLLLVERYPEDGVALVRLNRPEVLNALSLALMQELVEALEALEADPEVRAIVLTGNERAFAAGADITEMVDASVVRMVLLDQFQRWDRIKRIYKPLIAAVSGYALGGGCELAMSCDMIVASETARFGQPEINIGVMPGAGGTQRLARAIGKARAMEMVLTGRLITAEEAYRAGLINRVVPVELYLDEALKLAREVAARPPLAVRLAKEAVLKAFELPLSAGLEFERKNFYLLFGSEDQKEGMRAFLEKRPPIWKGK
ncbi:MAG: enoyl-CoA hydratase-related protein [Bacteroidetes bacterium]|nr:enoyl-CoA hydratase-related protein [Rhodothermia bacterium]MCS7154859.1 enoyl-CoA hydratase-related protein [Bacteroidota bacterium]MCX7906983.1 enoyl-CoA hydratase-related protein [Bacteroidota bacterium]MDW8137653.1 enoyl-CoA hydratase-related protein [Bacteroidota bacterium]MDW8285393.1 enoyl-CoA hydratase-related protein [Bacteroidota bacterium]